VTLISVSSGASNIEGEVHRHRHSEQISVTDSDLTHLTSHDFRLGQIDFHAEFIAQPMCTFQPIISTSGDTEPSHVGPECSRPDISLRTSDHSLPVIESLNIPTFTDAFPTSVMTTIEPRAFGAEAEYLQNLRFRHFSNEGRQRDCKANDTSHHESVIASSGAPFHSVTSSEHLYTSPNCNSLPQLPNLSNESYFQGFFQESQKCYNESHEQPHLQLKTEPDVLNTVAVKDEDPTNVLGYTSSPSHSAIPPQSMIPNFLHFTPDESIKQAMGRTVAFGAGIENNNLKTSSQDNTFVPCKPDLYNMNSEPSLLHMKNNDIIKPENLPNETDPCLLCAVCGDNAACQHYGVRTCEGCKGFFKRTVQKNAKYVCLADKNCPVDKRRRNRCQFCRYQKCLIVGMVKEVVRTDNLKGRRGRLPTKQRSNKDPPVVQQISMITALVRTHMDSSPSLENLDYSQYMEIFDEDLDCKAGLLSLEAARISQFYNLLSSSMDKIFQFCDKIPGFNDLCKPDRELLFKSACLELFTLRLAHRTLPNSTKLTFCNGTVLHINQVKPTFGDWLAGITELSKSLQAIDIDASAYACLSALTLVNERHGLLEPKNVDNLQTKILNSLRDHVTYDPDAQRKNQYFSRILDKLQVLRSLSQKGIQRIVSMRLENVVQEPTIVRNLFS